MVKFLREWAEGIIIAVFLALIIEMLVPKGDIKKYVRVIIGIYIVFVVLNPVISNIKDIDVESFFMSEESFSNQEVTTHEQMLSVYKKAIETEIEQNCEGIENVSVKFSEDLENIEKIEIITTEVANIDDIKKYIKENYDIEDSVISIIS